VRTPSPSMSVQWPTRTPSTSVIASWRPACIEPIRMSRSLDFMGASMATRAGVAMRREGRCAARRSPLDVTGWETFAVATGPAVVTAIAAYAASRQTTAVARAAVEADLAGITVSRVYDHLQSAYVALVEAEREWERQPQLFDDPEAVRRWNDTKFR